jgi:hypothetical protein
MKGYDGYFLLEYLIDQSVRPDTIIYSGSKIMYMTVVRSTYQSDWQSKLFNDEIVSPP